MKLHEIIEKAFHMELITLPEWTNEEGLEDGYLVDKDKGCLRDSRTGERINISSDCLFSEGWEFGKPIPLSMKAWIALKQKQKSYYKNYATEVECFCAGYEAAINDFQLSKKPDKKELKNGNRTLSL